MRRSTLAVQSGRLARHGLRVVRAAALLGAALGLAASALGAQGTPAGTVIRSWANVNFNVLGFSYTYASDTVDIVVAQVAGADVEPPRISTGGAGAALVFAHSLANVGNGPDSFTVAAVSTHGWPVMLYRDVNADGILNAGDLPLVGPVALGYAGITHLLVQVAIPNNASVLGVSDTVTIVATSRFDAAVNGTQRDRADVPAAPIALSVTKQVDRAAAAPGDVITYTLSYTSSGSGVAASAQIGDTIPAGTSYLPGTLRWNGASLTDASGDDAGSILPAGNGVVLVDLGALAAGSVGTVTFQAKLNAGVAAAVINRGHAIYAWSGTTDTTYTNVVQTNILVPALTLSKQVVGPSQAQIGQQVRYTLRYGNTAGAASVANAVLTDTLPGGLSYVSASPAATVAGSTLSWLIGTLAPGDSGMVDLVLSVNATVRDTVWARNVATLAAGAAATQFSAATRVALIGPPTAAVGLTLTANALDVGVGEVIPFTVVVQNSGIVPISDIRIDNTLPAGGSYARGSAIGADSALPAGSQLVLVSTAPLAPGATRTLHFAVALASAPGTVAQTRAVATAIAGALQPVSAPAIAWVQVRRAWPMETRAAIGKISLEQGGALADTALAGIDIWTEDGQVATTDATGKFSFANLRPGRHVLRLDPRTVPAGYRVAGEDLRAIEASGWTTPRADFRLVAVAPVAPVAADTVPSADVRAPINLRFSAAPVTRHLVRYEVTVNKDARVPLDAMVEFSPLADSALVFVGDSQFTRYTWLGNTAIPLPAGKPRSDYRIVAWSSFAGDSATATLRVDSARYPVRVPVNAPEAGVLTAWVTVPASDVALADGAREIRPATPALPVEPVERVTVPPARVAARTAPLQAADLTAGPGIEIFAPQDGSVLAGDRVYVGVKAEADAPVTLFDGARAIDSAQVRIDGVYDFVAVPLARGPHLLRVRTKNSWGTERWDSAAVHVTGLPASFATGASRLTLVADGRTVATAKLRVLDQWGVPVVQPAYVTVSAKGAEPVGHDADPSSVGLQQLTDSAGWLMVTLRPGRDVMRGSLELKSGDAKATVPLEVLPEVRPLAVTGSGMVGVGAAPDAYGAITARGQLDAHTSLTLGVDSRRLNDGQNVFGRSADPLAEAQYPILGDASQLQTRTASQNWVSARLERGFDWASFGDLSTSGFANGLSLTQYRRAVTGFAAHVATGAVTWSGFGSLTSQSLGQVQVRGAGISGPYQVAANMLPGTDNLRIETRDALNPERAVATQVLTRFVDYEIDYTSGTVLFKQPIPAADASGNPLFIVATYEAASGGAERLVAGGRAALDLRSLVGTARLDSLRVGVSVVNASQSLNDYRLVGGDVRAMRLGSLDVSAEVAYAEQGDSTGFGTLAKASYSLMHGAFTLGAGYMRVDREFINPSNLALQPGLTELNLKSGFKFGATELRAEHSSQEFEVQGVSREHSRVGIVQRVLPSVQLDLGVANDQASGALVGGLGWSDATGAIVKATWAPLPSFKVWSEAQRHVSLSGEELSPDYWGFGAAYRITSGVTLEAGQRFVSRTDSGNYAVSNLGVKADIGHGTQAWTSYQLTGGINGAGNAAIVGLRNQLQVTPDLSMNVMFERRSGVSSAALVDPVRALPFLQTEDNYWSAGLGFELLPKQGPYRMSARGEVRDGALQSTRLVTVAGDVSLDRSLALLTRQQFTQNALSSAPLSRQLSSVWGLAFRPARSDRFNMLAKLQWTDAKNPLGAGVLTSTGAERKLVGAAEMIWSPVHALELGARYAVRRAQADAFYPDGTPQSLTAWADYAGGRADLALTRWVSVRGDARVLVQRSSGVTTWDASPTIALRPVNGLELATGYRFGNLTDPDFSVRGGHGVFVTLSATLTEKVFPTAAAFWRGRF